MTIDDQSKQLFRNAVKDVKPLTHTPKIKRHTPKSTISHATQNIFSSNASINFDDLNPIPANEIIGLNKTNISYKRYQKLKSGKVIYHFKLDLHHYSCNQAEKKLKHFLSDCHLKKVQCCLIIHGKGSGLIKAVVNHHLIHSAVVTAFHSAQSYDGGAGAVYVLLKP